MDPKHGSIKVPKVMDPDLECIELLRMGDGKGLDLLMDRHAEQLHRFIFRHTNNEEDAADIAQETFVRVFRKAGTFKPAATVKTWMYTIALNLCRDRARRAARIRWIPFLSSSKADDRGPLLEDTTPSREPGPRDSASFLELESAIVKAIAGLPEGLRVPFTLCVIEGHSQGEAADILKLTTKSVEVRIYRARQQLRRSLGRVLDDSE